MKKFVILIVFFFLLSLSDASSNVISPLLAPTISPTQGHSNTDCASVIFDMMDCLTFLLVGSNETSPTKTCCVGIKNVVDYNPQCLCYGIKSSEAMGFVLDNTRAFAMPSTCNVHADPHCAKVASSPAPAPIPTPSAKPHSKKSPAIAPSLPTVTPSLPTITKPPVVSSRAAAPVSPTASSPAPSPSKSSSGNLSASKLFLAAIIVSSFAQVLA